MKYDNIIEMLNGDATTIAFHERHAELYNPQYLSDYNAANAMVNSNSNNIELTVREEASQVHHQETIESLPLESLSNFNNKSDKLDNNESAMTLFFAQENK